MKESMARAYDERKRKQANYPLGWCRRVWDSLRLTHPRGCNLALKVLDMSADQAIGLLKRNSPDWDSVKRIVHMIDGMEDISVTRTGKGLDWSDKKAQEVLKESLRSKITTSISAELTRGFARLTIDSRPIVWDGALPDEGQLCLFFEGEGYAKSTAGAGGCQGNC